LETPKERVHRAKHHNEPQALPEHPLMEGPVVMPLTPWFN